MPMFPTPRRWRDRLAALAEMLGELFTQCPYCRHLRGRIDCPRCAAVYHQGKALEAFADQLPARQPLDLYDPDEPRRRGA